MAASTVSTCLMQRCAVKPCLPLLTVLRPTPQPFRSATHRPVPRRQLVTYAKQDGGNSQLPALLGVANGITSSIAGFVPASVPRPVAKAGVLGVSGLIAFWIFGKVVSTLFTFALVAGAGYVFLKSRSGSTSSSIQGSDDGGDDPLASARRIMDKYK